MHGRKFLAYFMETSGTEFCVINYVYGGNECPLCDRGGVDAEFPGHWIAAGCDFLGQYAVSGRKSTDVESLVDRSDSGNFLVVVLMCITSLGHWLQVRVSHQEAKL